MLTAVRIKDEMARCCLVPEAQTSWTGACAEPLHVLSQLGCAGFHTFDYARHFMSCCSRMLGLEHVASRGSISIDYHGRDVGIKIMPTGVKPERFLNGFGWQDTIWRRGELLSQVSPDSRWRS